MTTKLEALRKAIDKIKLPIQRLNTKAAAEAYITEVEEEKAKLAARALELRAEVERLRRERDEERGYKV